MKIIGIKRAYLKFCKPHQRQKKYFLIKSAETAPVVNAFANMPYGNVILGLVASQFEKACVLFAQVCRSLTLEKLQSRNFDEHPEPYSFLHSDLQHVVCRSTDSTYQAAPKTYIVMMYSVNDSI